MTGSTIYELTEPTSWAAVPSYYSYSSLKNILQCPRRWQLANSEWGEQKRFPERLRPSAVEGKIVHESLEILLRALGKRGHPAIGSEDFQNALEDCGFWTFFEQSLSEWNQTVKKHPRPAPQFLLRINPRSLANQAIRLFRKSYTARSGRAFSSVTEYQIQPAIRLHSQSPLSLLERVNALTELKLEHPEFPFVGILDQVRIDENDDIRITDFKTGKERTEHKKQLRLYAVLWWRATGTLPQRIEAQYLGSEWSESISKTDLLNTEMQLENEISDAAEALSGRPAPAEIGEHCRWCSVKARCNRGWALCESFEKPNERNFVDLQVVVSSPPTDSGFLGIRSGNKEITIVYSPAVWQTLPEISENQKIRIVYALHQNDTDTVEIRSWTEVFKL